MTKIKICGIKTLEEALVAADAGADMLGFNFYPRSVRYIAPETCARISAKMRAAHPHVQRVGVFVNVPVEEIERVLELCSLDLAQLSGEESPQMCAALGQRALKSFHGVPDFEPVAYVRSVAPAFLLDAGVNGSYGGTGIATDWLSAGKLARLYPILLAGGLTPDNVTEAIERVHPWGVDVASGVESRPGEKDPGRIRAFVAAVRSAERKDP